MSPSDSSTLREFITLISTIRGDLSNITAPPFLLATQSTTQYPKYWAENPATFVAPTQESAPEKRALLVLRWFLSTLKRQQYGGRRPDQGLKKPLNAILGELFLAEWTQHGIPGMTKLVSEQVSHHPPITACCLWNDECGIRAEGYTLQEITFTGNVNVKQTGHAKLHIAAFNEYYLLPLPNVTVKGILSANLYPELNGTYYIPSSNGFVSEIKFTGKGIILGKKNSFEAKVYSAFKPNHVLYTVKGQWNNSFTITDACSGVDIEIYHLDKADFPPVVVPPIDEQDTWESQRVWKDVVSALEEHDMATAGKCKNALERAQRDLRAKEKSEGKKWQPRFFRPEDSDETFDALAGDGQKLEAQRTKGVWKFDADAFRWARRPFHENLTPVGLAEGEINEREAVSHNTSAAKSSPKSSMKGNSSPNQDLEFRRDGEVELPEAVLRDKDSSGWHLTSTI